MCAHTQYESTHVCIHIVWKHSCVHTHSMKALVCVHTHSMWAHVCAHTHGLGSDETESEDAKVVNIQTSGAKVLFSWRKQEICGFKMKKRFFSGKECGPACETFWFFLCQRPCLSAYVLLCCVALRRPPENDVGALSSWQDSPERASWEVRLLWAIRFRSSSTSCMKTWVDPGSTVQWNPSFWLDKQPP